MVFNEGVTSIGYSMFEECKSLKSVEMPNSLETVGERAFVNCTSLTGITIPDGVKTLGPNAFASCTALKSMVIGSGVKNIEMSITAGCDSLAEVYYKGTETDWEQIEIGSCNTSLTDVARYYYSETQPTEEGNYWHYVDGVVTKW